MKTKTFNVDELNQFTGTEAWYKHWLSGMVYTDGIKYMAEEAGAYWLIDEIAIRLPSVIKKYPEYFYAVKFIAKNNDKAIIEFTDGNNTALKKVHIQFTDFPVKEQTLTFFLSPLPIKDKRHWCLMLASEY
ncbi:MAG: hypothetical protein Q7V63_06300 [Gammaproteobacteria bacterium]|nr:hypothetical protein [Gammaproteobacteria bacterium]